MLLWVPKRSATPMFIRSGRLKLNEVKKIHHDSCCMQQIVPTHEQLCFSQAHAYQHNKKDEVAIPPPEAGSSHGCKVHVAV